MAYLSTLAIKEKYFGFALASMKSLHKQLGDAHRYVVFKAWTGDRVFDIPEWLQIVDIEDYVSNRRVLSYLDRQPVDNIEAYYLNTRYAARDLKSIPLVHPAVADDDVIFFDADTLAFDGRIAELIEEVISYDFYCVPIQKQNDQRFLRRGGRFYSFQDYKNIIAKHGYVLNRDIYTHAGLMGRKVTDAGQSISRMFDDLLRLKPLLWPREREYFGDEHYLNIAFQCAPEASASRRPERMPSDELFFASTGSPVTSNGISEAPKMRTPAKKLITPSMVHFVEQKQAFYQDCLKEYGVTLSLVDTPTAPSSAPVTPAPQRSRSLPFSDQPIDRTKTLILFGHLNKTGGTSYESALSTSLKGMPHNKIHRPNEVSALIANPENLRAPRFIYGHGVYEFRSNILNKVPKDQSVAFITLLREPFSRFESLYNYNNIRNARKQKLDRFFATYKRNPYTTFLGAGDLDAAKHVIENECFFVGTTEEFDYSFYAVYRALGITQDTFVNKVRLKNEDKTILSDSARSRFESENEDDMRLFDFVRSLLETRKRQLPPPAVYPFRFVDSDESFVSETAVNLDLASNRDPVSLLLSGRQVATGGQVQEALPFFEKAKDIDRSKFPDYIAFLAEIDKARAISEAEAELRHIENGKRLGDTGRLSALLETLKA